RLSLVRNVSKALFDVWFALYAASFGLLAYNIEPRLQESLRRFSYAGYFLDKYDEMTGRIRKMTRISSPPLSPHTETDIYFTMLSKDLKYSSSAFSFFAFLALTTRSASNPFPSRCKRKTGIEAEHSTSIYFLEEYCTTRSTNLTGKSFPEAQYNQNLAKY
ncbi:hypothetical protein PRIPAC_80185, partial [Pristionchus pacificus]|uniref:Uncharacterized protein n=1 Tax=Pristionchus pacificus TaxID=54126 RepID=A0A2A6C447_PRIPA